MRVVYMIGNSMFFSFEKSGWDAALTLQLTLYTPNQFTLRHE
jgi:hypothetical protein